jgi:hypothetical protein
MFEKRHSYNSDIKLCLYLFWAGGYSMANKITLTTTIIQVEMMS